TMTGHQTINGVAYTFKNGHWTGHDITVSNDGNVWKGTFTPDPETGFMAFKFVADTIVDNNEGMTFATMINKEDGRPWPEGYAAWGLLRSESYGLNIPDYIDFTKTPAVSDTVVYYWLNNEVVYNPSSAVAYAPMLVRSARAAGIVNVEERAAKALDYLLGVGTEEAMMNAAEICQGTPKGDSIGALVLAKYPNGLMSMYKRYRQPFNYRVPDSISAHYIGFLEEFPYTAEREAYLNRFGQSYENVYSTLMIMDAMNGNMAGRDSYVDKLSYTGCGNIFYKLVTIPQIRGEQTAEQLIPFADKLIARMNELYDVVPQAWSYMSLSEWHDYADRMVDDLVAETYSELQKDAGNYEKALEYSLRAQNKFNYNRAEINDNMAQIYKGLGRSADLKALLERSYFNNQISPLQTEMLREIYVAEKGSDEGFDAYAEQLKNPDDKSAIRKAVDKYRAEGRMPEWELTDAEGNKVSSADLRGKVYVVDFWANWCHPCKAALPGMQLAVNHFADDPNVEFLFIDTQEHGAGYQEKAKKYLKDKGLDNLHLVFDAIGEDGETTDLLSHQVMSQYRTSGIPLKVVVDGEGNVRFLSVGYKGSPSALCDEMIEMVEQSKK
ncbi:MAG: TlpA family protein disulfide reductase, partial [Duncaniella sp.]|nr:TlpA family protein disulfide reductase [Duncaniella sp.]